MSLAFRAGPQEHPQMHDVTTFLSTVTETFQRDFGHVIPEERMRFMTEVAESALDFLASEPRPGVPHLGAHLWIQHGRKLQLHAGQDYGTYTALHRVSFERGTRGSIVLAHVPAGQMLAPHWPTDDSSHLGKFLCVLNGASVQYRDGQGTLCTVDQPLKEIPPRKLHEFLPQQEELVALYAQA